MPPIHDRWIGFWSRLGAAGKPEPPYRELAARYAEPHRAYHTLDHISHCLDELDGARAQAREPLSIEMALWYHDAVYDPRAADNEEKSAAVAVEVLRAAGLPEDFGRRVAELIRSSTHRSVAEDPDARLFADIDLSILGQPEDVFDEYERRVRKEYPWVPEGAFRAGRAAILRRFLERPALYGTEHFRGKYERAARENLDRSLRRLAP